ncbi:hypothetical protein [Kribbella ginsengisoli]
MSQQGEATVETPKRRLSRAARRRVHARERRVRRTQASARALLPVR